MTVKAEVRQKIVDAYLSGMSYKAAGELHGVGAKATYEFVKAVGKIGQGGRAARIGSGAKQACALYLEGKRYSEIARELKVQPMTVSKWIRDAGIESQGGSAVRDAADRQQAIQHYRDGATVETISRHLGRGTETVSGWLKGAGVEVLSGVARMGPEEIRVNSLKGVAANKARAKALGRPERICALETCGKVFVIPYGKSRNSRQIYCSRSCFNEARTDADKKVEVVCSNPECGKQVLRWKSSLKGTVNFYCSNACQSRAPHGIQARFEDNVMQSRDEMAVFALLPMFGVACERFDRRHKATWTDHQGRAHEYSPDFWLPAYGVALEIKGLELADDPIKWQAYREQVGPLLVYTSEQVRHMIERGELVSVIRREAQVSARVGAVMERDEAASKTAPPRMP